MSAFAPDLNEPQLFLDDYWVADCDKVERRWHEAQKYPEMVLRGDKPWEWNCPVAYGSVLFREGRFQMWYCGWTKLRQPLVCYAESGDGVHWEKPVLGLHEVDGSKANNVVFVSHNTAGLVDDLTVIDDSEDTDWPLKALYWDTHNERGESGKAGHGIWAAKSKDGIHWEEMGQVLPWGDRFNALSTRFKGEYLAFGRPDQFWQKGRSVARASSKDLLTWSEEELVLTRDAEDPVEMEIYSHVIFPYGDLLLGGIERMHMTPDVLDTEIAWSRDAGRTWLRSRPRPSFIPRGEKGHWDSVWLNLTSNAPVRQQGELWFFYSGRSGAHGVMYPRNFGGIGLATLRVDGFASFRATTREGWILTRNLTWTGGDLGVNIDCRRDLTSHPRNTLTGGVSVEVIGRDGGVVSGFSRKDMVPLRVNTLGECVPVRWGERSLNELAGQEIQLRFGLRDAHLFSFKRVDVAQG